MPNAREAGIAHYIDQRLSVPPQESLLQARIFNFRPPFAEFYRNTLLTIDDSSRKLFGKEFAQACQAGPAAEVSESAGLREGRLEISDSFECMCVTHA